MKRIMTILPILIFAVTPLLSQPTVYKAGEKVVYNIQYGFFTGGIVTFELKSEACCGVPDAYHTVLTGHTTGLADAVFEVKDVYESYFDPRTELPLRSIRDISEGKYRKYNVVEFDRDTRADSAILKSDLTGDHVQQWDIHDILTCFYWFRNHTIPDNIRTMRVGDTFTINTWFTDEFFPIIMKYMGTEEIKTHAGKINCYKFGPVCEVGRLFRSEDAISFWFSADRNFLPVKIRFEIVVGAFEVDMVSYEGLKYPLDIRKK